MTHTQQQTHREARRHPVEEGRHAAPPATSGGT